MVLIWLMAILNIGLAQKDTRSGDAISDLDTGDWMGYIVLLGCKFHFCCSGNAISLSLLLHKSESITDYTDNLGSHDYALSENDRPCALFFSGKSHHRLVYPGEFSV